MFGRALRAAVYQTIRENYLFQSKSFAGSLEVEKIAINFKTWCISVGPVLTRIMGKGEVVPDESYEWLKRQNKRMNRIKLATNEKYPGILYRLREELRSSVNTE